MDVTQILQQLELSTASNSLSMSAYSRALAPSRFMCYSALQDSTAQLTMTVRDNLLQWTQDCNARSVQQNQAVESY
jgi:hypothetical protein